METKQIVAQVFSLKKSKVEYFTNLINYDCNYDCLFHRNASSKNCSSKMELDDFLDNTVGTVALVTDSKALQAKPFHRKSRTSN